MIFIYQTTQGDTCESPDCIPSIQAQKSSLCTSIFSMFSEEINKKNFISVSGHFLKSNFTGNLQRMHLACVEHTGPPTRPKKWGGGMLRCPKIVEDNELPFKAQFAKQWG